MSKSGNDLRYAEKENAHDWADETHTYCNVCGHWLTYYTTTGEDIEDIEDRVGAVAHYFKESNGYFETEECFTSVPEGAFNQCETLKSISLPFATEIQSWAFSDCRELTEVKAPEAITIGDDAFSTDIALTSIYLPKATTIGGWAFEGCAMTSLALPAATNIGEWAIHECENLTELTLPCNLGLDREFVGLNENVAIIPIHKGYTEMIAPLPATCTEDGCEEYEGCTICYGPIGEKVVIPARGHDYDKHMLTYTPDEHGLYAYACDRGCGAHSDDHIVKNFNGEGNHLELTMDGEGNYSTSEDITLADANGFMSPVDFTANSATYTRTGIKNQWGTIVVPFTFTTDDAKGYEFYTLASAASDEITLAKVENGTNVVAGTPMIVRVKSGSELTLTASTPAVTVQAAEGSAADGLQVAGTYEAKVISPADYFIANNMFWNAGIASAANDGAQVKVNPFRAYLKSTGAAPLSQSLAISVADEDATGAAALNAITSGTAEYYDMNGRKLDSLQQGVNIVKYGNGVTKKIIIK